MVSVTTLEKIKLQLNLQVLAPTGCTGSGCISSGETYNSDKGKLFIKRNEKDGAAVMFEGEFASLKAIQQTGTIKVPTPEAFMEDEHGGKKKGAVLVMEYLDLGGRVDSAQLGAQLADLHLHNRKRYASEHSSRVIGSHEGRQGEYVDQYGFDVPTCCGFLPQRNDWCQDWQVFMCRKIDGQLNNLKTKSRDYTRICELWGSVQREVSSLFAPCGEEELRPSLLHGDLWSGNMGAAGGQPVIIDPASFYGHHEYDLAIADMFGGFDSAFWTAYFKKLPKTEGYEGRHELYKLFHYLNHWNHFGSSYASSSLHCMENVLKLCKAH